MTAIETLAAAEWSKPKNIPTRRGPKSVRSTLATPELLALFDTDRDTLAAAGFSISEYDGVKKISWWADPVALKPRKSRAPGAPPSPRERDPLSKSNVKDSFKKYAPRAPMPGWLSGRTAEETRAIIDRGWNADLTGPREIVKLI